MKVNSFNKLIQVAKETSCKRIAVVMAEESSVLKAVERARKEGMVEAILFGKEEEIRKVAIKAEISLQNYEIVNVLSPQKAAYKSVRFAREGKFDMIMKGNIKTADLFKTVLDKDTGLRIGRTLNVVSLFEIPGYNRLIMAAGGAIIINPTLKQKVDMINNCVEVTDSLGWENPLTAIIAGIEVVNPKMPATVEAAILSKMYDRGQIKGTVVDGPFAIDNAISVEAARIKHISSPVAGKADILIMPNIEVGNIFYKTLVFLGGARVAPTVAGAAVPIVITSRADTEDTRLYSIALSSIYAEKRQGY